MYKFARLQGHETEQFRVDSVIRFRVVLLRDCSLEPAG